MPLKLRSSWYLRTSMGRIPFGVNCSTRRTFWGEEEEIEQGEFTGSFAYFACSKKGRWNRDGGGGERKLILWILSPKQAL